MSADEPRVPTRIQLRQAQGAGEAEWRGWLARKRSVAVLESGPKIWYGTGDRRHIVLLLKGFKLGVRRETLEFDDLEVSCLQVDQRVFRQDVEKKFLGGLLAEHVMLPYRAIQGEQLLTRLRLKAWSSIISEVLTDLVLEYGDLAEELLLDPMFFLLEYAERRARIFPLLKKHYATLFRGREGSKNIAELLKTCSQALEELEGSGVVVKKGRLIGISEGFVAKTLREGYARRWPRVSFLAPFIFGFKRRLMSNIAETMSFIREEIEQAESQELEDPRTYLYLEGYERPYFIESSSAEELVRRIESKSITRFEMKKSAEVGIAGVLNTSYVASYDRDGERGAKVVVKKFDDWTCFKWLPIALYALGVRDFAILGKVRMAREIRFNRLLQHYGFKVPKILGADWKRRLLVKEYIEGETFAEIVRKVGFRGSTTASEVAAARMVGRTIGQVHKLGLILGDCKPSNMILRDGDVYLVDLEQSSKKGDQAWDLAVLVYFLAHYAVPMRPTKGIRALADALLDGYLEAGGPLRNLLEVTKLKYTRLFAIITLPLALVELVELCKEKLRKAKASQRPSDYVDRPKPFL